MCTVAAMLSAERIFAPTPKGQQVRECWAAVGSGWTVGRRTTDRDSKDVRR
jgi:hypothetical protein